MAEMKRIYRCGQCGYSSPRWLGKCPDCNEWDTFVEELERKAKGKQSRGASSQIRTEPLQLAAIPMELEPRRLSHVDEWDRVLGGGLVEGSLVLLAGDPGIGKSTLLLQVFARYSQSGNVLYVSGEESPQQIKIRSQRLGIDSPSIMVLSETDLEAIVAVMDRDKPHLMVVDSIQTVFSAALDSAPGSVSQVRECASRFLRMAKEHGIGIFLVGHVTKEGAIAGPRALEHLVDTVLYLEGDRTHTFRLLRAVKNRFGSTNEIGVFEMKDRGLDEVPNPSQFLLAERPQGVSGSVVVCTMEGTRPLLVELQALVSSTNWLQPRRTSMGVDGNRLSLLLAVLEKKIGFNFTQQDVFVNVAGGIRLQEPAGDLALTTAIVSSYLDRPLPGDLVFWGEVGLAGEVRGVGHSNLRALEAQKLGFTRCVIPAGNAEQLNKDLQIRHEGVKSLQDVMDLLFA